MGRRESNPGEVRLYLSGPSAIHDAVRAARDFAVRAALDPPDGSRLAILVEELVANLYDHGRLAADDVVELALDPAADGVSLTLVDPGKPFDPGLAALDTPIPRRGGGAGLRLLRSWAGRIDYRSAEGRNRLTLLIPRQGS